MRGEYVRQPLGQPAEIVAPCRGCLGIFGVRLFVNKNDIKIGVIAEFLTTKLAVGNDAQFSTLVRSCRCL